MKLVDVYGFVLEYGLLFEFRVKTFWHEDVFVKGKGAFLKSVKMIFPSFVLSLFLYDLTKDIC